MAPRTRSGTSGWRITIAIGVALCALAGLALAAAVSGAATPAAHSADKGCRATSHSFNMESCVIWKGTTTRLARCRPACEKGDLQANHRTAEVRLWVTADGRTIVSADLSQACRVKWWTVGNWSVRGGDRADADGRFSVHKHYRNPQSGQWYDTYFKGRFSGDTVTGKAWARYRTPGRRVGQIGSCDSAVLRFSAKKPASEPTETEPTYTQPTYTQPTYTHPTYTQPTYTDPTYTDPTYY